MGPVYNQTYTNVMDKLTELEFLGGLYDLDPERIFISVVLNVFSYEFRCSTSFHIGNIIFTIFAIIFNMQTTVKRTNEIISSYYKKYSAKW